MSSYPDVTKLWIRQLSIPKIWDSFSKANSPQHLEIHFRPSTMWDWYYKIEDWTLLSSISRGNAASVCKSSAYSSSKADEDRALLLLFLDLLLGRGRFSCGADCNTGKIRFAGASYSFFSGEATLGCLWGRPILTVCLLIVFSFLDYSGLVKINDYNKWVEVRMSKWSC